VRSLTRGIDFPEVFRDFSRSVDQRHSFLRFFLIFFNLLTRVTEVPDVFRGFFDVLTRGADFP
jgi:hypothetical protein